MRLKSIKLSGFKSFVETTKVSLPGDMAAIVGPNGCGKSNVIDAVRWVLGESAAKTLRGAALTDVIFNGAEGRQPVGMAQVELIFDNSDMRIQGEYAAYHEIAIKRQINRDAESGYFINQTRVRRRDISDLLSGTGLGPRSYAIIEQGMINQLIEAKPEKLRVYIEEAAGITQYKTRRQETENKMKHTREHLARLKDIQHEIETQLEHLEVQVGQAQQYRTIQSEIHASRVKVLVLEWQRYEDEQNRINEKLKQITNQLEALKSAELDAQMGSQKQHAKMQALAQQKDQLTADLQAINIQIARQEEAIKMAKQAKENLCQQIQHVQQQTAQCEQELIENSSALKILTESHDHQILEQFERQYEMHQTALDACEKEVFTWEDKWQKLKTQLKSAQTLERETHAALSKAEYEQNTLQQSLERVQAELQEMPETAHDKTTQLTQSVKAYTQELTALTAQLSTTEKNIAQRKEILSNLIKTEQEIQAQQVQHEAAIQASEMLLQKATGLSKEDIEQSGLNQAKQLIEKINVVAGYEKPVEVALDQFIHAYYVKDMAQFQDVECQVTCVDETPPQVLKESIAQYIEGPESIQGLLSHIFYKANVNDALKARDSLKAGQYFVTQEGACIGPNWFKSPNTKKHEVSLIETQKSIQSHQSEAKKCTLKLTKVSNEKATIEAELVSLETQFQAFMQSVEVLKKLLEQAEIALKKQQLEHSAHEKERAKLLERQIETTKQIQANTHDLDILAPKSQEAVASLQVVERSYHLHEDKRDSLYQDKQRCAAECQEAEKQIALEKAKAQNIQREKIRLTARNESIHKEVLALKERLIALQMQEKALVSETDIEEALQTALQKQLSISNDLEYTQQQLSAYEEDKAQIQKRQRQYTQEKRALDAQIADLKLKHNTAQTRQENVSVQVNEKQIDIEAVSKTIETGDSTKRLKSKLTQLELQLEQYGAINLAAEKEYDALFRRKEYYDNQQADLDEALSTLDQVIQTIDDESAKRFKSTYETVNQHFQILFPEVFGGGQASLQLTEKNMLSAGLIVKAQPPGKKNNTIHLLSGGEKALTALALVFAIFKLNPAPFCLLDEVDAPLDDENTRRYANLLKSLSHEVQFIFITHNKLTMEQADQLVGVTMKEPGVSRLVSVDINEALALAELEGE